VNDYLLAYDSQGEGPKRVTSQPEMDALFDALAARPPTWLELVVPGETDAVYDNTVMNVGLGREFSSLTFYEKGNDGARYDSTGTLDGPQESDFGYGGTPTSIRPGSAIALGQARAAAAEFLKTGCRPEAVSWTLFDQPYKEPEPFNDDGWEEFDPGPSSAMP
jgi:hypothetical protein